MSVLLLFCLLVQEKDPCSGIVERIQEKTLRERVQVLASDEMEGRAAGFPGNDRAADFLVETLRKTGLKPGGEKGGWTQEFEFGEKRKSRNVLAILEGGDETLRDEVVVVSAHFDHVGKVGQEVSGQSGEPKEGDGIWNGADDNASGTSAVLTVAEAFAASGVRPKRSILFAFWSAEEAGLLGSEQYVQHPTRPLEKHVFCLNMDMIGRNPDRGMDVEGLSTSTGDAVRKVVLGAGEREGVKLIPYDFGHEAMYRSDGANFLKRRVPVVMFFMSWHDDYHRVTDHADKIAYAHLTQIARMSARVVAGVADLEAAPRFNEETGKRK